MNKNHSSKYLLRKILARMTLLFLVITMSFVARAENYEFRYLELREIIWGELHLGLDVNNNSGIEQRRNRLNQLFSDIPKKYTKEFQDELGWKNNGREFSIAFHSRLSRVVTRELMGKLDNVSKFSEEQVQQNDAGTAQNRVTNDRDRGHKTYSRAELLAQFDTLVRKALSSCKTYSCLDRIIEVIAVTECEDKRFCSMTSGLDGRTIFNQKGKLINYAIRYRYAQELNGKKFELDALYPKGDELSVPIPKSQRLDKSPNQIAMEQLDILRGPFFSAVIYSGLNPKYESTKHKEAQAYAKFMDTIFSFRADLTKSNNATVINNRR